MLLRRARPKYGVTVTFPKYSQHHNRVPNRKWYPKLLVCYKRTQTKPNAKFTLETNYGNSHAILLIKQLTISCRCVKSPITSYRAD